jgi:CcmD family protein
MDSKMLSLAIVPLIVWIGLFLYLLMIDRKLSRLEQGHDQDDL